MDEPTLFLPIKRVWSTTDGFSSDEMPCAGPPVFPDFIGKEAFSVADAGAECTILGYRGVSNVHIRNEVSIITEQPFLMIRSVTHGRDRFLLNGVGEVVESPENINIFFHEDPGDTCVSEHHAHETGEVLTFLVTADRFRTMCDGMPLPKIFQDIFAGTACNSLTTLKMSMHFRRLFNELTATPYSSNVSKLYREGKILEIMAGIIADLSGLDTLERQPNRDQAKIDAVCERLLADLSTLPNLDGLAGDVGLTQLRLSRSFKETTGVTIAQWILDQKMDKAAKLLVEGNMPVKQIAHLTGYAQVTTFTAAFKSRYGCPPAQYRRSLVSTHFIQGNDVK